jgi:futalosine hydrolase
MSAANLFICRMDLLLTAATGMEIAPSVSYLKSHGTEENEGVFSFMGQRIRVLVSGAGILQTSYRLTTLLHRFPCNLAIQAGIAGSFTRDLEPGSVVIVEKEILADTGAEDAASFIDLFDIGLLDASDPPFTEKILVNPLKGFEWLPKMKSVTGITVNMISGSEDTIRKRRKKYQPDIETMEGAAFHYICLCQRIPFLQIRSISNLVEIRNKENWKIPLALTHLNEMLISILEKTGTLPQ